MAAQDDSQCLPVVMYHCEGRSRSIPNESTSPANRQLPDPPYHHQSHAGSPHLQPFAINPRLLHDPAPPLHAPLVHLLAPFPLNIVVTPVEEADPLLIIHRRPAPIIDDLPILILEPGRACRIRKRGFRQDVLQFLIVFLGDVEFRRDGHPLLALIPLLYRTMSYWRRRLGGQDRPDEPLDVHALRLDLQDLAVVRQVRVRAVQHCEIGQGGHGHAQVGEGAFGPDGGEGGRVAADDADRLEELIGVEACGEDEQVECVVGATLHGHAAGCDFRDASRVQVNVTPGEGGVEVVGHDDAFATEGVVRRELTAQLGVVIAGQLGEHVVL